MRAASQWLNQASLHSPEALVRVCLRTMQDEGGNVIGAEVKDTLTNKKLQVYAKQVINATGPFTDSMRQLSDPTKPSIIMPSAGQLTLCHSLVAHQQQAPAE